MTEEEHLLFLLEKLKNRIAQIDQSLQEGALEVEKMHDYYWSNYNEMDEYGYENFDNRQALLTQLNANNQALEMKARLRRMEQSPYFGRVDFVYDGDGMEDCETYYIGIGNFSEGAGNIPWIIDWRAPVASLFYDYDRGEASFEAPGGQIHGNLVSKWQYKIRDGKLLYAFESDVKIDDEVLKQELAGNGAVKLKNIIATIQREQNAIIRNVQDRILVVQGVAGSGKTSIALHRIAYLLYHDRKNLKASNILILSPNSVFSDYISHILPELGEENIREMSFDIFAYHELKAYVKDTRERYDQIEYLLAEEGKLRDGKQSTYEEDVRRYQKKQSREMVSSLLGFALAQEYELVNFKNVKYKHLYKSGDDISVLFYEKFPDIPILSRMEAIAEYVIDEAETLMGRDFEEGEPDLIKEQFFSMYATRDLYVLYSQFLESIGEEGLPHLPREERILSYEDVFPMLYLKLLLLKRPATRDIKHLVVDEMQDYSYLQYQVLAKLFDCRMTIVGDRAQTMDEQMVDVCQFLPKIFDKNLRCIQLTKSYRQTMEIAKYAASILGDEGMEYLERHGKEPLLLTKANFKEAMDWVHAHLEEVTKNGEYETLAVLTLTEEDAIAASNALQNQGLTVHYMDRNSKEFHRGITVTPFYLAKGLEFDDVVALYPSKACSTLVIQGKYIMATRALHELSMVEYQ